jgi:hypothetical protein
LVREQDAVGLVLAEFVGKSFAQVLVVVRVGERKRRCFDEFGATQAQKVLLFLTLGFWNDDQRTIAARAGHDRKPDPGIARGRLDNKSTRLEFAALLGFQDHPFAGPVLDRLPGIHEFGLSEDRASGQFGSALQLDQGGVADRFDDVIVDCHVKGILCRSVFRSGGS